MPIRTADEYRSALARLEQERVIMRSRCFTDDEQRDFDSLTSDIAAYEATRSAGSVSPPPAAPPRPSSLPAASSPPSAGTCPPALLADDMRARLSASMQRELARQGLVPAPQGTPSASMASMEREIRRMGLTPRGAA
ncbi:hypothetical protein [Methylobacterium sp. B4]|uniref:hypothetical protein n=1 Tax=Methylobacterium sp. B4 TaxID=1938755 RepID=UPI000D76E2D2|nr:hypothetical protein [Methylobacterium sp. B4]PXW59829.1 hypothetical protein BY998_11047 [Methylobacterium sp. B4]